MNRIVKKCMNMIKQRLCYLHCDIVIKKSNELLKNDILLITGGGSGIGRAVACKAVQEGADVIVLGRREEKLRQTCTLAGNQNCKYIVFDLSKDIIDEKFWSSMEEKYNQPVTCLINNAGICLNEKLFDYNEESYQATMNVNFKAAYRLSQSFMSYLIRKKIAGKIVFVASNRGIISDSGIYGISKSAMIHYVKGLAKEAIKYHIRVNAVAPGMTASEINGLSIEDNLYNGGLLGKRVILAEEIAEVICFLATKVSNCINGAIIPCDEGEHLR